MLRHFVVLLLVATTLAGCAKGDDLIHNDCTEHPMYGAGNPMVTIETNMGNITAEIFVDKVPNTGMNFVKLAEEGTFDGSPFHRIISDFMMQGGDHTNGNGSGGSAHGDCALPDGDIEDEFHPDLRHDGPGVLSMANTGQADSGSSQFFITFTATSWLDTHNPDGSAKNCGNPGVNCHAVFGKVVAGLDVVQKVNEEAGVPPPGTPPAVPVTFESATVAWP